MGITHTYYKRTQSNRLKQKMVIHTQVHTLIYKAISVTVTSIHGT